MKNAFLPAVFLVLTIALTGCGDVHDNRSVHVLAVQVLRNGHPVSGQPVGVAIRTHFDNPYTVKQGVVTDRSGTARADFPAVWGNAAFNFPSIGAVPRQAPRPLYIVEVKGQDYRVTPKTANTTYLWNGERWETRTTVELP